MKTKILTIDDTFSIQGLKFVITARKTDEFVDFKIGDTIEIETENGKSLVSKITSIPIICRRNFDENSNGFNDQIINLQVGKEIKKSQLSKGAAIWLLNTRP